MNSVNRIISVLLIVAGIACVVYGTCFHSVSMSGQSDEAMTVAKSELALTQEASVGGAELDEATGEIKQTYTGESPKACPT